MFPPTFRRPLLAPGQGGISLLPLRPAGSHQYRHSEKLRGPEGILGFEGPFLMQEIRRHAVLTELRRCPGKWRVWGWGQEGMVSKLRNLDDRLSPAT